jgi:hypothetical protein
MHGLIFTELQKYVNNKFDYSTWKALLEKADLKGKLYVPTQIYPDSDVLKIVEAASKATKIPQSDILEDFGKFMVPDLLKIYSTSVKPEWKTLDMLENIEGTIHRAVRQRAPGATPPSLVCTRLAPNRVEIVYSSERKLCPLALGLIKGVAQHYQETVNISEPSCMLRGDAVCRIVVEK